MPKTYMGPFAGGGEILRQAENALAMVLEFALVITGTPYVAAYQVTGQISDSVRCIGD